MKKNSYIINNESFLLGQAESYGNGFRVKGTGIRAETLLGDLIQLYKITKVWKR